MKMQAHPHAYQFNFNQWQRIQQRDAVYIVQNLQNQIGMTLETIRCFQGTLPMLRVDDDVLRQIKSAVAQVSQAMEQMRTRFRAISFDPSKQWMPNEQLRGPAPIGSNFRFAPISFIPMLSPGEFGRQRTNSYPGFPATEPRGSGDTSGGYDGRRYAQQAAQIEHLPIGLSSLITPEASEKSSNDEPRRESPTPDGYSKISKVDSAGSERASEPEDGEVFSDSSFVTCENPLPNGASPQTPTLISKTISNQRCGIVSAEICKTIAHERSLVGSPERMRDRSVASTAAHVSVRSPSRNSLPILDRGNLAISGEVLQPVRVENASQNLGKTLTSACEVDPARIPQEILEPAADKVSTPNEGKSPEVTETLPLMREEPSELDHLLRAVQENPLLRAVNAHSLLSASEKNSDRCLEIVSNDGSDTIVYNPSVGELNQLSNDLPFDPSGHLQSNLKYGVDPLGISLPVTPTGEVPLETPKYRCGRDSSLSNGSHDGFCSPVPSENKPRLNVDQTCPQLKEIDELARSLEQRWSLNEAVDEMEIRETPLFGAVPKRIEDFRIPPPLKHVLAVVSHCPDEEEDLCVQLMEDETLILGLDVWIERSGVSPPLKFSEVQPGDFVLCLYELDKRFYRAQLLRAKGDDKFEVRFIDYGNTCISSVKNMRKLPAEGRKAPQFAVKCEFSDELKAHCAALKKTLQHISLAHCFLACFGETHKETERGAPIFTLIDLQAINGSRLLPLPPKTIIGPAHEKFLVQNLEFKALGTIKLDLVQDLSRKLALVRLIKNLPTLPCKIADAKVGTLVTYKYQRAMIAKVEPNALVSLELIDELRSGLLRNVPIKDCCFLPLACVTVPPSPSRIVCLHRDQDMGSVRTLCETKSNIEMTVVETDASPLVKFAIAPDETLFGSERVIL